MRAQPEHLSETCICKMEDDLWVTIEWRKGEKEPQIEDFRDAVDGIIVKARTDVMDREEKGPYFNRVNELCAQAMYDVETDRWFSFLYDGPNSNVAHWAAHRTKQ